MSHPPDAFRLTLLTVACLGLLYVMMVVFQSNERPWLDGARMWLPFLVATLPPYLIVLWRLNGRPDDPVGLGVAIASGVLAIAMLVLYIVKMATVKEMAPLNLFVGLLFWHITLLTALVIFVPLQIKLIVSAFSTLSSVDGGRVAMTVGLGLVFGLTYTSVASAFVRPLAAGVDKAARRSTYSQSTATKHLFNVYICLWRQAGPGAVNGFPESEEALRSRGECWDPTTAPGGSAYGTHYKFRYFPGPRDADGVIRSFALATRKRNAPGNFTDSYYLDHLGVLRRSVEGWATETTDRIESFKSGVIPELIGLLDSYHALRGAYPVRLFHESQKDSAGPHDLVIPQGAFSTRGTELADDATVIDTYAARIVYRPQLSGSGGPASAYTVSIRSERKGIHDIRSYFIATDGRIHGTGEDRDATEADPVAPDREWPPNARESARQRATAVLAAAGVAGE